VYVEEFNTRFRSVSPVSTHIAVFIGHTEKASQTKDGDLDFVPTRISSLLDYERFFGKLKPEDVTVTIEDELAADGGGSRLLSRKISAAIPKPSSFVMYYQLQMFFSNGGGDCYIVSAGRQNDQPDAAAIEKALLASEKASEAKLIVLPESCTMRIPAQVYALYNKALLQARQALRFVVADAVPAGNDVQDFRNNIGSGDAAKALAFGAAYYPMLRTALPFFWNEDSVAIIHQTRTITNNQQIAAGFGIWHGQKLSAIDKLQEAILYQSITDVINQLHPILSPSAAVAGVYCQIDAARGVWKAPANVSLNNVIAPVISIDDNAQQNLNVDSATGKSINAIRLFTGKGILIWGARTLAGNDNEWRYISVRRFFNMVEESITNALAPMVFEPNDANTWIRAKNMIENYLTDLWRQGALMGSKPEQAFFVNVGLGSTMTANDIAQGRMITEIGMACVRPAEFIILKLLTKMADS
jgi:phage tail sheath protein FI